MTSQDDVCVGLIQLVVAACLDVAVHERGPVPVWREQQSLLMMNVDLWFVFSGTINNAFAEPLMNGVSACLAT